MNGQVRVFPHQKKKRIVCLFVCTALSLYIRRSYLYQLSPGIVFLLTFFYDVFGGDAGVDQSEVPPIDYFMLLLGEIPRVKERLKCILLSVEFEEKYEDVLSKVTTITTAVRKMKASIQIKTIMETILALGNYINGSTSKGQCVAFKLKTLETLPQTKGDKKKIFFF